MKIKVNTNIIKKLNPCSDRLDNYVKHYKNFNGDILQFLALENITAKDKIWVSLRLVPLEVKILFALDCAIRAGKYSLDADAADAAAYAAADVAYTYAAAAAYAAAYTYAAADATDVAADAAAYTYAAADAAADAERELQVDSLAYLIKNHKNSKK